MMTLPEIQMSMSVQNDCPENPDLREMLNLCQSLLSDYYRYPILKTEMERNPKVLLLARQ